MKTYTLIAADGKPYQSKRKGIYGGHRKLKIYGRLDCPSALRWIKKGYYTDHRVFFASREDAEDAGYRACKICRP